MPRSLPRLNIVTQFVLFLFFVSIVPLFVVGTTSYHTSRGVLQEEVSASTAALLDRQSAYLDLLLETVENLIANLAGIKEIHVALEEPHPAADTYTRLATHTKIGYILNGYLNLKGLVAIDIVGLHGAHYHVGETLNATIIDQAIYQQIYAEALQSDQLVVWTGVENNFIVGSTHQQVVTAAKLLKRVDDVSLQEEPLGLLLVSYSTGSIYDQFRQFEQGDASAMLIIDAKRRLVFHPNQQMIGAQVSPDFVNQLTGTQGSLITSVEGREMLVTYCRSRVSGWLLVSLVPVVNLTARADTINKTTALIVGLCFVFISLATIAVTRTMVSPLRQMTALFQQIQAGDYRKQVRLHVRRTDEIGDLLRWFNIFLDSLEARQRVEQELREAKEVAEQASAQVTMLNQQLQVDNRHLERALAELELTQAEICHLNTTLEQRVQERTLQLSQAKDQLEQSLEQLHYIAHHDSLTGLANRVLLNQHLHAAMERSVQDESDGFALLLLDVDDFKRINDGLGHLAGDMLLVQVAGRLRTGLRPIDIVARLGGDEFAILLNAIPHLDAAVAVIQHVQQTLLPPFDLGGHSVSMSVSMGVVRNAAWHTQALDVLRDADIALYQAKARGNGQYAIFDALMYEQLVARLNLEVDLRRALEQEELRVYYQPIVELPTGKIRGFEALVRWQHPQRGLLTPADFIEIADETGLDIPMDRWVLRQACYQIQAWACQFPKDHLRVSVNLSSKQVSRSDLVPYVKRLLIETQIDPAQLMLEITETSLIDFDKRAIETLQGLRALQVKIGLDDFGTGYSSLSYLHRFPVDVLKIDRSFIRTLHESTQNIEIVRTLIKLADILGMDVVAEGAETAGHLACLSDLKCRYVQGFVFARPLDSRAAHAMLVGVMETVDAADNGKELVPG